MDAWRRWSGAYVVLAVAGFVYLLSRSLALAAAAAVVFAVLAWVFRPRGKEYEPVMLAIAAVTLSTMHQSSLGSLFLLMPDKLGAQWWSPVLPVSFFLSSIASGTALVILRRDVDRQGLAPDTPDEPAGFARQHHLLVAAGVPRLASRRHGAAWAVGGRVRRAAGRAVPGGDRALGGLVPLATAGAVPLNEPGRPS